MSDSIALLDDPDINRVFDLAAAVARSRRARVAIAVEAVASPDGDRETMPDGDGGALAAACATTFGAPVGAGRFRVSGSGHRPRTAPTVTATEAVEAIAAQCGLRLVVVGIVCVSLLPLWEALHRDERTRKAPKIGFTAPLLDVNWNLAQKLLVDGKLSLHEHSLMLGRRFGPRLDLFLSEHARRGVSGAAGA